MNWFEIVVACLLLYSAASLRIVGPKELGCVLLFGRPLRKISSGLVIVPFGIYTLVTETSLVIQDELPAEPDKIYRGSSEDIVGETVPKDLQLLGFKPPIRITFSDYDKTESEDTDKNGRVISQDDPYNKRLTAEVVPVIRWRIEDFIIFMGIIGSIDEARKQMEDTCVKIFTQQLTKVSPAIALCRIGQYSEDLQAKIEQLTNSWGVKIESAEIKAINFSQKLNDAVQNVVVQERAKKANILMGEGLGGKEKAILNGRAEGLTKMHKDLEVDGGAVLGAETARAIAGEGDKSSQRTIIAGSGGFADLIGTAMAIGESLKTKPKGEK